MRITPVLVLLVLLLARPIPALAQSATPAVASPVPARGDFAGLVDIGGRKLYLECHGEGSPTVVLISGYRSSGRYWTDDLLHPDAPRTMVLPGVAETTRVCTYDRPGAVATSGEDLLVSRSDPVAQPRTTPEAVVELHALLQAAAIPGPYVLAAHSWGGFLARLYASTYPDDVVGLVLVDAYSERVETLLPPARWAALVRLNQALGSTTVVPLAGYGDEETVDYYADNAVVRAAVAASPLPPMPLAVLAHGRPFDLPAEILAPYGLTAAELEAVYRANSESLATLVPQARFFVASQSGHDIHQDQPELVVEAIRQVVEGVRHPDTWYDLASCCATNPTSGQAQNATPAASPAAGVKSTAIVVSATNDPLRVPGSDGVDHLEYDLLVTNGFTAPVTLTSIAVLASDGEPLLQLDGDALVTATQPLIGRTPTAAIPASGTVAVVMDVTVPPDRAVERLDHRITYEVAPDAPVRSLIGSFGIDGPQLPVDPRPTTILAPPLRGDGWLANSGCCAAASIHRGVRVPVGGARIGKPETFAIDFARLRDGQPFAGDGARPEDWYGFGAEVLAVANGAVVAVHEGYPEQIPQQPVTHVTTPEDFGGNAITLEIAPGVYAYYAHLQPGSITVAVGDQVTTGQVLGRLGNTGNSSGPHLHFGLIDDPDPLVGASLPMAFDHWTLQGNFDLAAYDARDGDVPAGLILLDEPEPQTGTLQLYLDVADFG